MANRENEKDSPKFDGETTISKDNIEAGVTEVDGNFSLLRFRTLQSLIDLFGLTASGIAPLFLIGGSLPAIVVDVGGANSDTWCALVNSLACAAVAPFAGALSDIVGRRYVALSGPIFTIIGAVILGTAHRMETAIAGCAIAGVGAGISQSVGIAGAAEMVPVRMRGRVIGNIFMGFCPLAGASAFAIMYSYTSTWRWTAWISSAIAGTAFVILAATYFPPPRSDYLELGKSEAVGRIDWIGGILSISGVALFLAGLQFGGYTYPWRSVQVITTITVGLGLLAIFVFWQSVTRHPMISSQIFANKRNSLLLFFILAMGGAGFYAMGAYWQLEMGQLFSPDVYSIARVLIPYGFAFLIGCLAFSASIDFTRGAIREILVIAAAMMTAGIGAMVTVSSIDKPVFVGLSFLAMLGVGGLFTPPIVALLDISPDEILGSVAGLALSIRLIGGQIGYTIFYNILQPKLTTETGSILVPALVKAGLPPQQIPGFLGALLAQNTTAIIQTPGFTPGILVAALEGVNEVFLKSFPIVYYAAIGFGVAAVIASLLLGNIRKYITDRVAVDIH